MHVYPSIHPPNRYIYLSTSSSDVFSPLQEITRAFQVLCIYMCVCIYICVYTYTHTCICIHPSIHRIDISIYQHPLLMSSLPCRRLRAPSKCYPTRGRSKSSISIHPSIHRISIYLSINILFWCFLSPLGDHARLPSALYIYVCMHIYIYTYLHTHAYLSIHPSTE